MSSDYDSSVIYFGGVDKVKSVCLYIMHKKTVVCIKNKKRHRLKYRSANDALSCLFNYVAYFVEQLDYHSYRFGENTPRR